MHDFLHACTAHVYVRNKAVSYDFTIDSRLTSRTIKTISGYYQVNRFTLIQIYGYIYYYYSKSKHY